MPNVPDPVEFKAKYTLPVLEDYGVKTFPEEYWSHWIKKSFVDHNQVMSWVDPDKLYDLAVRAGYNDMGRAKMVCDRLRLGAKLSTREGICR